MSKRIFITGGASGLGRALAERFARAGWRVCIADLNDTRGAETLTSLKTKGAAATEYLHCDVTREEDLAAAARKLEELWGGVDVVVNNAGVAQAGAIDEVSIDDWRWIIDINLLGVVRGCRIFTPMFKKQRGGHFVNVASMAGLLDAPMMSSYNATKAAVVSLSETLQNELADSGIHVSVVCPAFFKTNLGESLRSPDARMHARVAKLLNSSSITAEDVAEKIFQAVEHKRFYVVTHPQAEFAWMLKRLLPRPLYLTAMNQLSRGMMRGSRTAR
jgi:NAD(P)-dependent dehydrogenase (short-subunit alcohol dehydrogenase family)